MSCCSACRKNKELISSFFIAVLFSSFYEPASDMPFTSGKSYYKVAEKNSAFSLSKKLYFHF